MKNKSTQTGRRKFLTDLVRIPEPRGTMTLRTGVHGEKVSVLGYGAMRFPTVDGSHANSWIGGSSAQIDQDKVNEHIDYCLKHGVNYFDTSPVYCRNESEEVLGKALSRHPRSSYYIATKLSNFAPSYWPLEKSKEMFETSLKRLRTDYVDYYLLHAVGIGGGMKDFMERFVNNKAIEWLVEERKAGRIRNLGFSYHGDPATYRWLMDHHDKYHWDFAQIQMNYIDWRHAKETNPRNLDAEMLYGELTEKGIPVVVMEPLLGGRLAHFNYALADKLTPLDPEASLASWAFRFCAHYPNVLTVLSGMTYLEHIKENVATLSPAKPLTDAELATLEDAARDFLSDRTIPCTGCEYCMPCPYGLDIPTTFACWNSAAAERRLPEDKTSKNYAANKKAFFDEIEKSLPPLRRPDHCISCGRCTPHCPQRIDIPTEMRKIDSFIEEIKRHG